MRKVLKFAGIAAAAAFIAGCNPPPAATQQTACNCHGTVTTSNPGSETQRFVPPGSEAHRTHHRTRYAYDGYGEHRYRHHDRYAEHTYVRTTYDEASYDYHSTSHVYHEDGGYDGGSAHAYAYASSGGYARGSASGSGYADGFVDASDHGSDGWQDGYGRWHNRAALGAKATRTRLDPYHGYNIDCPNGPRHRH